MRSYVPFSDLFFQLFFNCITKFAAATFRIDRNQHGGAVRGTLTEESRIAVFDTTRPFRDDRELLFRDRRPRRQSAVRDRIQQCRKGYEGSFILRLSSDSVKLDSSSFSWSSAFRRRITRIWINSSPTRRSISWTSTRGKRQTCTWKSWINLTSGSSARSWRRPTFDSLWCTTARTRMESRTFSTKCMKPT